MPLSEDEQRILSQIEERFYQEDPEFAREVGETSLYRHALRNVRWGILGFIVAFVFLVAMLSVSFWLALVGFLAMFAAAVFVERNVRSVGKAGMQSITGRVRPADSGGPGISQRFRKRFRNED